MSASRTFDKDPAGAEPDPSAPLPGGRPFRDEGRPAAQPGAGSPVPGHGGGLHHRYPPQGSTTRSRPVPLVTATGLVLQPARPSKPPPKSTAIKYTESSKRAGKVEAFILPGKLDGGAPSANPIGWAWLYQNLAKVKGRWVRFHILNRQLGGAGDDVRNLVPTTHLDNHDKDWRQFEEAAKSAHEGAQTIYWEGQVGSYYDKSEAGSDGFPKSLYAEYFSWNAGKRSWDDGESIKMKFLKPTVGKSGGTMLFHAAELTAKSWQIVVGVKNPTVAKWLSDNRKSWMQPESDIVSALEEESYKHMDEAPYKQAGVQVVSALSGKRTKRPSIYQGLP